MKIHLRTETHNISTKHFTYWDNLVNDTINSVFYYHKGPASVKRFKLLNEFHNKVNCFVWVKIINSNKETVLCHLVWENSL